VEDIDRLRGVKSFYMVFAYEFKAESTVLTVLTVLTCSAIVAFLMEPNPDDSSASPNPNTP